MDLSVRGVNTVESEVEPVDGVSGVLGGPMEPFRGVGVTCCISNQRHMC